MKRTAMSYSFHRVNNILYSHSCAVCMYHLIAQFWFWLTQDRRWIEKVHTHTCTLHMQTHTEPMHVNRNMRGVCSSTGGRYSQPQSKKLSAKKWCEKRTRRYKCDKNESFMNTENAESAQRAITQSVLVCMWHGVAAATLYALHYCCWWWCVCCVFSLVCNSYLAFVCVWRWASSMPIYLYATSIATWLHCSIIELAFLLLSLLKLHVYVYTCV